MTLREIKYYETPNGSTPFEDWFYSLDPRTQAVVARMIQRVSRGESHKSVKALKNGVFEIKFYIGPGYRVYFSYLESGGLILLLGGDKSSQKRDISKAKKYWREYGKST